MTEFAFDLRAGGLLIGEDAIALRQEESGHDVVPLIDLLQTNEIPVESADYPNLDCTEWEPRDYVAYGQWILRVLRQGDQYAVLRARHIRRIQALGLGPGINGIVGNFGRLSDFKEAVGSAQAYGAAQYESWTTEDFITYALTIAGQVGGKPTSGDYRAAFLRDEGPSPKTIFRHVGIARLNELIGYPDIRNWEESDYIAWGARLLRDNGVNVSLRAALPHLSRRKLGPGLAVVQRRFGSLIGFRWKAQQELERQERARQENLDMYRSWTASGRLPEALLGQSEEALLAAGAKLQVARICAPGISEAKRNLIVKSGPGVFMRTLLELVPNLTEAQVEATAAMLQVFDDIWRPAAKVQSLRIEPSRSKTQAKP